MKQPKDKRTRAYKKWKAKQEKAKAKFNVGDTIAKVTEITGIKKAVKYVFGEDCGCEERQQKINSAILRTFGKKHLSTFTEQEYDYLIGQENLKRVSPTDQQKMREIFERVFKIRVISSCSTCSFNSQIYKPLMKLLNLYK